MGISVALMISLEFNWPSLPLAKRAPLQLEISRHLASGKGLHTCA